MNGLHPAARLKRLLQATPEQLAAVDRILWDERAAGTVSGTTPQLAVAGSGPAVVSVFVVLGEANNQSGNGESREQKATSPEPMAAGQAGDNAITNADLMAMLAESRFVLRKELHKWSLVMNGQPGVLDQGRAVQLVEHLLKHPHEEAIHALELESRVDGCPLIDGVGAIGRAEEEGDRPAIEAGELGGVIQERTGRKFVGGITLPALKKQLAELRAASEDLTLPEQERADARQEFLDLLRAHGRGGKLVGDAGRAVDRVRKRIWVFIRELKAAEVTRGKPNEALRAFGHHLEEYLWRPSMGGRKRLGAAGKPGCFTYEPPPGVRWSD